jgi:hypothetical protein
MAQRVQIVLEDDLDGGVAAETVTFGLDGVSYEIDLSDKNAGKLRTSFREWLVEHLQCLQPPRPLGRPRLGAVQRPPGQRPGSRLRGRPGGVRQGSLSRDPHRIWGDTGQ